ncbi:MAG: FadR family transcriptional regulator [Candidatus Dormibacteraeota bacterium]|nr:FadR family transcriptional regulator [Candidatus Dormibacteraeota bacterium]MBO0761950.1 FadR family transcriptional regulator [Candidatus Dormibacteraeota bacterium]
MERTAIRRNLREQIVDVIGGEIASGRLRPGDALPPEEVLLERYRVSRTVLREAVNVLAGKGILDARPRRGTVVRPRSEWNQLDPVVLAWQSGGAGSPARQEDDERIDRLMEVRRIVEPEAAALAARRGTSEDLAAIRREYEAMERAVESPEAFMDADLAFHVACLYASNNDYLAPIAHAIRTEMMASLRVTNRDPKVNRDVSLPLHKAILDAVLAREPERAAEAMRRHLEDTERRRARVSRPRRG